VILSVPKDTSAIRERNIMTGSANAENSGIHQVFGSGGNDKNNLNHSEQDSK